MRSRRFEVGDDVLITIVFGSALDRPFERGMIIDEVFGSIYQYIVAHGGRTSFACDGWLQPMTFLITEDVEWEDLVAGVVA